MEKLGINHLIPDSPGVGAEATAMCGFVFTLTGKLSDVVCSECVTVLLKKREEDLEIINDLHNRMYNLALALDDLEQQCWIPVNIEQSVNEAFWKPGPARQEGPRREDGRF